MNFIECNLSQEGDRAVLTHGRLCLTLPPKKSQELLSRNPPQQVLLGARPETILLSPVERPGAVAVEVYVTEPQGHEIIVDLRFNTQILRVRGNRETHLNFDLRLNEVVYMSIDPARTYVFDKNSGERLA